MFAVAGGSERYCGVIPINPAEKLNAAAEYFFGWAPVVIAGQPADFQGPGCSSLVAGFAALAGFARSSKKTSSAVEGYSHSAYSNGQSFAATVVIEFVAEQVVVVVAAAEPDAESVAQFAAVIAAGTEVVAAAAEIVAAAFAA